MAENSKGQFTLEEIQAFAIVDPGRRSDKHPEIFSDHWLLWFGISAGEKRWLRRRRPRF